MCERAFIPKSPKNKYCGDLKDNTSCAKKRLLYKRKKLRVEKSVKYTKNCKNCLREFTTTKPEQIYCGSAKEKIGCSFLFRAGKEYKQDLSIPKKCAKCNGNFMATTPTKVFCGSRQEKTGCAYQNELEWISRKRAAFTPEEKRLHSIYKLNRKNLIKYGLTAQDYVNKLEEQKYKCAISPKMFYENGKHGKLFIDHNHETSQVRGLLCHGCNSGLGMFMENEELMLEAINYIKKWNNS